MSFRLTQGLQANTPSSGLSYMDFQKQFFGEPSVDAFKVKMKEDGEHHFRNLKVPIFLRNHVANQFFCEQPPVDALKVKIKEDGEHFQKVAGSKFLLNDIVFIFSFTV